MPENPLDALGNGIRRIQEVDHQIIKTTNAKGLNWRKQLVQLRREMSEAVGQTSELIQTCINTGELTREQSSGLRSRLSEFRHVLALHQANFPAAGIDESTSYMDSSALVRERRARFVEEATRIIAKRCAPS